MSNSDTVDDVPAWGSLPVEQYLIRKWNYSSPLTAEEQREQLVEAYIEEDSLDPELTHSPPTRIPTAEEIRDILEPWRPQKLRRIAKKHLAGYAGYPARFYFLRPYYSGNEVDNVKMREWSDASWPEMIEMSEDDKWWLILDDPELFNFGDYRDSWQKVYKILPELAAPGSDRTTPDEYLVEGTNMVRDNWEGRLYDAEPHEYMEELRFRVARAAWLCIIDEDAFSTGNFYLMFRDYKGNVVKESPIEPIELVDLHLYGSIKGSVDEQHWWLDGVVGKKYRAKGSIMGELLPRIMEKSAREIEVSTTVGGENLAGPGAENNPIIGGEGSN